jgi:type IV pilus assembly protein PilA
VRIELPRGVASERGFTLIELIVVMLILGLLATIAIPAFLNQREKAHDADAKGAVRTAQTAMETYGTENAGVYTGASRDRLRVIEPSLNEIPDADFMVWVDGSGRRYFLSVESQTGNQFNIARGGGTVDYWCATAGTAGCPASGLWDR